MWGVSNPSLLLKLIKLKVPWLLVYLDKYTSNGYCSLASIFCSWEEPVTLSLVFIGVLTSVFVVLLLITYPSWSLGWMYIEIAKFSSGLKLYNSLWGATIEEVNVGVVIKLTKGALITSWTDMSLIWKVLVSDPAVIAWIQKALGTRVEVDLLFWIVSSSVKVPFVDLLVPYL